MRSNPLSKVKSTLCLLSVVWILSTPRAWAADKYAILHEFHMTDGETPQSGVIFDKVGNFYGTVRDDNYGSHLGIVFEMSPQNNGTWKFQVLYRFTGGDDGSAPQGDLVMDAAGNLYGTASYGGSAVSGTVYKLSPKKNGTWTLTVLYTFQGEADGKYPIGGVVFGKDGSLYGTTQNGGNVKCFRQDPGCGTVFKLTPTKQGPWKETVLFNFNQNKGYFPNSGVSFDQAGNLYGTAPFGGTGSWGVTFKLTPQAHGHWTETLLHQFTGGSDGYVPVGRVIVDQAGNVYGATQAGGDLNCGGGTGCGLVYELLPNSKGGWDEKALHQFEGPDGTSPEAGLTMDQAGNFYSTTVHGGNLEYGVVYELSPNSKGGWDETVLFSNFSNEPFPISAISFDASGNLYGTTAGTNSALLNEQSGQSLVYGSVYQLKPKALSDTLGEPALGAVHPKQIVNPKKH